MLLHDLRKDQYYVLVSHQLFPTLELLSLDNLDRNNLLKIVQLHLRRTGARGSRVSDTAIEFRDGPKALDFIFSGCR